MNTANTPPRFRTDLVAQPIDEGGQRFIDVTDPDSGKTFRFYEVEYSIACAMDGSRDLAGLAEWAQAEIGLAPSAEELQTVISTLEELGYLEAGPQAGGAAGGGFDLGLAGVAGGGEAEEPLPSSDDFELGTAGKSLFDNDEEAPLDSAALTLGLSGNEEVVAPEEAEQVFTPPAAQQPAAAGRRARAASNFETPPTPPPPDVAAVQPVLRPMTPAGQAPDEDDGPTNLPPPANDFDDEMSVDLTDHMSIGTADVQEAIRQSKAMQAVDMPQAASEPAAPAAASQGAAKKPQPQAPAPPKTESGSAASVAPTELPDKPAMVSKPVGAAVGAREPLAEDKAGPGAAAGGSRSPVVLFLLLLLLVLLLGAAAAAGYFYWQSLQAEGGDTGAAGQTEQPQTPPEPPPPPEPPSAALSLVDSEPVEVKATRGGRIAEIAESGKEVAEGDIVVKLNGYQGVEKGMDKIRYDQERYQKRIAENEEKKAAAGDNESAIKRYQRVIDDTNKKLERENAAFAEKQKELDAFLVRAPIAGTLETKSEAGAKVDADQVVFLVTPPELLDATFSVSDETERSEGQEIVVALKADESKKVTCQVTAVDGDDVTVACSGAGELGEGDEIILP